MAAPASLRETVLIDGHQNGPFDGSPLFLPNYPATMLIKELAFGAAVDDNGYPNDFDMRNIIVGSQGLGSSDLWAPTFTSTVVPPFDAYVGAPGDLTVSGGVITVANAGFAAYGTHALAAGVREIWVQYDLFFRAAMFTAYSFSANFHTFYNQTGDVFGGISIENILGLGEFWVDSAGSFFFSDLGDPGAPTLDTWMTVQYYAQVIGGTKGRAFDGAPNHKAA